MILHIITKDDIQTLEMLIDHISESRDQHSILLTESAIYLLKQVKLFEKLISTDVYILENHACGRGFETLIPQWIKAIDYPGFVQLVTEHNKSVTW